MPKENPTELIVTLWRHWVWADNLRQQFFSFYDNEIHHHSIENVRDFVELSMSNTVTNLFISYGLLYVVCDGIESELSIRVNEIAPSFENARERLRRFRNAVFHVQPEFWSPKLLEIFNDPNMADEIALIHQQVGDWLKIQMKSI